MPLASTFAEVTLPLLIIGACALVCVALIAYRGLRRRRRRADDEPGAEPGGDGDDRTDRDRDVVAVRSAPVTAPAGAPSPGAASGPADGATASDVGPAEPAPP